MDITALINQRRTAPITIDTNDVHVWSLSLQQPPPVVEKLRAVLSSDELERAARFYFDRDRRRFIVRRGALRYLLSQYVNIPPYEIGFNYSDYGRPTLPNTQLDFNLSDSDELVIYGLGYNRSVGIDVELIRRLDDMMQLAAHTFAPEETAVLQTIPDNDLPLAFFNCWTRKEAYIKAIGQGLSYPLDKFLVSLHPNHPAQLIRDVLDPTATTRWHLKAFTPVPGYIAALVSEGQTWQLQQMGVK